MSVGPQAGRFEKVPLQASAYFSYAEIEELDIVFDLLAYILYTVIFCFEQWIILVL